MAAKEKKPSPVWRVLFPAAMGLGVWLFATVLWAQSLWGDLKMNEIVAQLSDSIEGTGGGLIPSYLLRCVIPGAAALGAAAVASALLGRLAPERQGRAAKVGTALGLALLFAALGWAFAAYDVGGYLVGSTVSSGYIEDNYTDPRAVKLTFPEVKRNLIVIWLESMEVTYADAAHGGAYEVDRMAELTALAEENVSFAGAAGGLNGAVPAYGSTWTSGALFAQTTGLPLKGGISGGGEQEYLNSAAGVVALGDILADNGYRQRLRIGSPAAFGGRLTYFTQHGGYEIRDYDYSVDAGEVARDHYVNWGYEDEVLFALARADLLELAAGGEPFNLSLLTADTHFPDGYRCRLCGDAFGDDQYSNVIACSSRQVAAFVAWVREQPFYENTTILITGDHLTMDAGYSAGMPAGYFRRVYTTVINPAVRPADPGLRREYTTMDLFPTTLAALGVDIEGGRLGLGVDLFSGEETLLERDGLERLNGELPLRSELLEGMAQGACAGYGADRFEVDGAEQPVAAFKLNETNYIRLEDAAILLAGSEKQFDVSRGLFGRLELTAGRPYSGGEGLRRRDGRPHRIEAGEVELWLDGSRLTFAAYESEGSYYLKLRDLAAALDFSVGFHTEGHRGIVVIDTTRGYGT